MEQSTHSPRPALDYATAVPGAYRGPGIGTMVCDFLFGSAVVSGTGYGVLAYFALSQNGGMGLEGVILVAALVGLVVLNGAMVLAVYFAASSKARSLKCPVTVRPRWLMFLAGLVMPILGIPVAWFSSAVLSSFLGWPAVVAAASAPAGIATWFLARPPN